MIYNSKYEAILKFLMVYLIERYGGMLSRFDFFLLWTARSFGFVLGGSGGMLPRKSFDKIGAIWCILSVPKLWLLPT